MAVTGSTVGVYTFAASGDTVARTTRLFVRDFAWVCSTASTAGDHLLVTDSLATASTIFEAYASGAYTRVWQPAHRWFDGITVASMTSGTLYVYTGNPRLTG